MKWCLAAMALGLMAAPSLAQETAQVEGQPEEQAQEQSQEQAQETAQRGPPAGGTKRSEFAPTRFAELTLAQSTPATIVPTASFAGRSAFRSFHLSPSGDKLLLKTIVGGKSALYVVDPETQDVLKNYVIPDGHTVDWLRWAGNEKVIFSLSSQRFVFGFPVPMSRVFVRNVVNDQAFMLTVNEKVIWGGDLVHLADDGSYALISVQKSVRANPAVYRYELVPDGKRTQVVKPKNGVWDWIADDDGIVRLGMGWRYKRLRIYYRTNGTEKFKLVGKLKQGDEKSRYWSVVQIVSGSDQGYILEEGENGRVGVRVFDYAKGEVVKTFYENPDWDIEELWLDEDGEPLAAFYTDDRDQVVWFDPEQEKLYTDLGKATGMQDIVIVSRSRGNARMIIWAGHEADPGALYVFTPKARSLEVFADYRPGLDWRQLTKPQPVSYAARDGLEISAYLTLPRGRSARDLPLIIMPHGGPYGVRDKLVYNDTVQLLANRGFAVLQPNYRGSGGYGDTFFEAGTGEIGRKMQDDLDDAMDWAVGQGIADPARVCVVGGSYGGYAALWAVLRNPERYRCAASWAGVTDFDAMLKYDRRYLGRKAGKAWRQRVEGAEDFDLDEVSPVHLASQLSRPVLLAHGTQDTVVPIAQYKAFEKASKSAPVPPQTLVIEGEGHGFSSQENEQAWYDSLERFLAQHNPADPAPSADDEAQGSADMTATASVP